MLTAYPRARAWYSFTLRDSEHLSDGTPLREVMTFLEHYPQTVAVGINCIALQQATAALQHLHGDNGAAAGGLSEQRRALRCEQQKLASS